MKGHRRWNDEDENEFRRRMGDPKPRDPSASTSASLVAAGEHITRTDGWDASADARTRSLQGQSKSVDDASVRL